MWHFRRNHDPYHLTIETSDAAFKLQRDTFERAVKLELGELQKLLLAEYDQRNT